MKRWMGWTAVLGCAMCGVMRAQAPTAPAAAPAAVPATGSWKIAGDVQGVAVTMTCALVETDRKLTGTCSSATDPGKRAIEGEVTEKGLAWSFDSSYEGNPITLFFTSTLSADGAKMTGTLSVAPMDVSGTFSAVKAAKPDAPPPTAGPGGSTTP